MRPLKPHGHTGGHLAGIVSWSSWAVRVHPRKVTETLKIKARLRRADEKMRRLSQSTSSIDIGATSLCSSCSSRASCLASWRLAATFFLHLLLRGASGTERGGSGSCTPTDRHGSSLLKLRGQTEAHRQCRPKHLRLKKKKIATEISHATVGPTRQSKLVTSTHRLLRRGYELGV